MTVAMTGLKTLAIYNVETKSKGAMSFGAKKAYTSRAF